MRALTQIVNELAPAYQNLNGEQKTNLAIAVAGTHHYARFLKLMENNERTQELMIQSTLGLSPAMDEVNIRLQNQVTVLREAEARLDKYKGTLGDALTPSVIMATQVQAEYNKQLTSVFGGRGGDFLNNLFGVSKVVQDTAAGFFQNFVNIVQMNVALATQKVLTASLRGEEMIREDFMSTKLRERGNFNRLITDEMREQNEKAGFAIQIAASLLDNSRMTMLLEQDVTQEKLSGIFYIHMANSSSDNTHITFKSTGLDSNSNHLGIRGSGIFKVNSAVDGVSVFMSSGNVDAGAELVLYKVV